MRIHNHQSASADKRRLARQGCSEYVASALLSGVNPVARQENGAVNLAYAGIWIDKLGYIHCIKRRSHTRESLNKQLYKPLGLRMV